MESKELKEILTEAEISLFSQLVEEGNPAVQLLKAVRSLDVENPEGVSDTIDKIRSFDLQIRAILMIDRGAKEVIEANNWLAFAIYCLHQSQASELDYAIIQSLIKAQTTNTSIQTFSSKKSNDRIYLNTNQKFSRELESAFSILNTQKLLLPSDKIDIEKKREQFLNLFEKFGFINTLLTPLQDVIDDVSISLPDDFRRELENLKELIKKAIEPTSDKKTQAELLKKFSFLQDIKILSISLANHALTDQKKQQLIDTFKKLFELEKYNFNEEIINGISCLIKKTFFVGENIISQLLDEHQNKFIEPVEAALKEELNEFFLVLKQDAYTRLENGYTLTEIAQSLSQLAQLTVNFLNIIGMENITPQEKQQNMDAFKNDVGKLVESDLEITITKALSKLMNAAAAAFIAKPLSKIGAAFYTPPVFSQAISRTEDIYNKNEKGKLKPHSPSK